MPDAKKSPADAKNSKNADNRSRGTAPSVAPATPATPGRPPAPGASATPRGPAAARRSGAPRSAGAAPAIAGVPVGALTIGGPLPTLIMGPCVIESRAHALKMARIVRDAAAKVGFPVIFKASFDKANRSSHASYRGQSLADGLAVLAAVKAETGLPVTTDVHESWQPAEAAAVVDLLQVPALLCRQSDLIDACARSGRPTSVKKGQFLAPWDCANIVAKFRAAGGAHIALIERGTSFGYNTLVSDFRALPIMRALGVPVIFDGTHSVQAPGGLGTASGGDRRFAPALMRAALAVGCEGIFLETHDAPERAPSDGPNMIPAGELDRLLADLAAIHAALGRPAPPAA